jgi:bacterial/archaeal transporter family-2 protein
MRIFLFFATGVAAGSLIAFQNVFNATMGKRIGNLGSVLILTLVSLIVAGILILVIPHSADFTRLPGLNEWYIYLGGVLGVGIVSASIYLLPQIGSTATLTALVVGQLSAALVIYHFGLFGSPKIEIDLGRIAGVAFLVLGAYLIGRN